MDSQQPGANCYWEAFSALLYGSKAWWRWVKADHIAFVEAVLTEPNQPRYDIYREILANVSNICSVEMSNICRLLLNDQWTSSEMIPITCDRYNLPIVLLIDSTVRRPGVTPQQTWQVYSIGPRNSKQRVLWKDEDHHFESVFPHFHGIDDRMGHNWDLGELRIKVPLLQTNLESIPRSPNAPLTGRFARGLERFVFPPVGGDLA